MLLQYKFTTEKKKKASCIRHTTAALNGRKTAVHRIAERKTAQALGRLSKPSTAVGVSDTCVPDFFVSTICSSFKDQNPFFSLQRINFPYVTFCGHLTQFEEVELSLAVNNIQSWPVFIFWRRRGLCKESSQFKRNARERVVQTAWHTDLFDRSSVLSN